MENNTNINFPTQLNSYDLKEVIGIGSPGVFVYKITIKDKENNNLYALKQIDSNKWNRILNGKNEFFEKVKNEAKLLQKLNSKYIIKYYTSFEENNYYNIITEYCSDEDLNDYYNKKKRNNEKIDEKTIWIIFLKILLGIAEIHENRIIHRDIKPLNIFIKNEENLDIKIGDLGEGKLLLKNSYTETLNLGTEIYRSPEQIENDENGNKKYSNKIDIWSLGITLYELCTFRNPFGFNKHQILKNIKSGNFKFEPITENEIKINNNNNSINELNKIIELMLKKNPKERPSAKELLNNEIIVKKLKEYNLESEKQLILKENNINNTQIIPEDYSEHFIDKLIETIPMSVEKEIEDVNHNFIKSEETFRKINSDKQITYNNLNLEEDFYYENLIEYENQIQIIEYNIKLICKEYDELIKNEKLKSDKLIEEINKEKDIDEFYNMIESYIDINYKDEENKEKIKIKIIEIIFNIKQLLILKQNRQVDEERKRKIEEEKTREEKIKILKEENKNKINKPKDSKQIFKYLKNKIKDYNKDRKENEKEIINIFEERNKKFNQNKNLNKCIYFNKRENFKLFNKNNYSNIDFSCVCSFCQNKINQKIIKFEEVKENNSDYKLCNNCCNKIIKKIKNNKIEKFIIDDNKNENEKFDENINVDLKGLYLVKNNNEYIKIVDEITIVNQNKEYKLKLINLNYEMIKEETTKVKIEFQINSENNNRLKFIFKGVHYDINGPDNNDNYYVILNIYYLNKKFPGLYIYSGFIIDSNNNQSSKYMFSIKIE